MRHPLFLLWVPLLLCLLSASGSVTVAITVKHASENNINLIENGSFEEGDYNFTQGGNVETINQYTQPLNPITGWVRTYGEVEVGKGRWKRASDCSLTCLDLNGGDSGTIHTSFQAANASYPHTILLDATTNPDAPSPVNGTLNVTVLSHENITINSSLIHVDGRGYNEQNIGWHTYAVFFTMPPNLPGNLTLSLSSNIRGWYGPLIDNVRLYEGLHYPNSEQDATCPDDQIKGGKSKLNLIIGTVVPSVLLIILCIGVVIWWRRRRSDYEVNKAMSVLQGRLKIFPYSVLKSSTRNFHQDLKLGQGTFGAVYKGILEDGSEIAIKQLFSTTPRGQEEFLNEAMVISTVQHRNLVALKGCCARGLERFLVCEYVENKSLHQVLWGRDRIHLEWPTRFKIVLGTARGLAYLHEASQPRIIHRDIKGSNILLDKNFEAKIADFGLARGLPDDKTHVSTLIAGTMGYVAPEYAMRGQLTEKADVFSFGVVVLEVVSGRKSLDSTRPLEDQYLLDWAKQLCSQGRMKELIDPELQVDNQSTEEIVMVIRVGLWCTREVAGMRPTMSEALSMLQGISSQNDDKVHSSVEMTDLQHMEAASFPYHFNDSASFSMPYSTSSLFSSRNIN